MEALKLNILSLRDILESIRGTSPTASFVVYNNVEWENSLVNLPHRAEAFLLALCTSGSITVMVDMKQVHIKENTFILYKPSNVIEVTAKSHDYKSDIMMFSQDHLFNSLLDVKSMIPIFHHIIENSSKHADLSVEEANMLHNFFELIGHIERNNQQEVLHNLIMPFFRLISELFSKRLPKTMPVRTRQEEYFERFVKEVSEQHRYHRSVQYYAGALHITPKYLSSVIKDVSGKSAAEWIDDFVVQEAKIQLKFSTKSIQEISYFLNFSTQSFFGKYFKRHTGMSPSEFRTC